MPQSQRRAAFFEKMNLLVCTNVPQKSTKINISFTSCHVVADQESSETSQIYIKKRSISLF
jgi:hypothetical protein